jgi:DNA polymerase
VPPLHVPAGFLALCEDVVRHRDPGRFDLLYRLLWRLQHEPGLREDRHDPDRVAAREMAQAVRRDRQAGAGGAPPGGEAPRSLPTLREALQRCRECPIGEHATRAVPGEGPKHPKLMFVGEQPGDQEDVIGRPFVGPAGQVMDRALEEAGIDRKKVYVTNAVKHFKFLARGKIRLHQKPTTSEIKACRPWYERELTSIKPDLVVAMGATAAQSVFGKITPINKNRGRLIDLDDGIKALVTVHPSYLLRLPDADAKAREYRRFVDDLKIAAARLRKSTHAA